MVFLNKGSTDIYKRGDYMLDKFISLVVLVLVIVILWLDK